MKRHDKGEFPFYCSDKCYADSYKKLKIIYEKNSKDIEKTWAAFEKEVWGK